MCIRDSHNANWKLAWNHAWKKYKLDVTLFGRYQSTRFYITDGDGKSYQLWRLNTRHNVLKKKKWNLDINVGIDNIFDYVDRTPSVSYTHLDVYKRQGLCYCQGFCG